MHDFLRTPAQRPGHGKGIKATVLVPITTLVIEARHYMEEDEVTSDPCKQYRR